MLMSRPVDPFSDMTFSRAVKYLGSVSVASTTLAAFFSSSFIPNVFPSAFVMSVAVSMISSILAAAKSSSLG